MIELELLGADGDQIVMADQGGERYSLVVDDALRGAVRRVQDASLSTSSHSPSSEPSARPRDLQALMRGGASAQEVAQMTGLELEHVRRFEGPVLAEQAWAVKQAKDSRIGWEKDSPLLGELVIDRLATRGVDPSSLQWEALRQKRQPWQILLTFVQGAEVKQARWELDLSARSVTALDDEARWLTETAISPRSDEVFDQDSPSSPPATRTRRRKKSSRVASRVAAQPANTGSDAADSAETAAAAQNSTDTLLADLASNRGQRVEIDLPDDALPQIAGDSTGGQVVSMDAHRRSASKHPAGTRLEPPNSASAPSTPEDKTADEASSALGTPPEAHQEALPHMPPAAEETATKPKRQTRRPVPSWDEIVFGAKPE